MTHCHTTHSDGRATVLEMARAAAGMGMGYMTITDHSPTAGYAGRPDRRSAARAVGGDRGRPASQPGCALLRGTESDILADGRLDYPAEVLARLDVVIASDPQPHGAWTRTEMTAGWCAMMRLPLFKIWGHGLGRCCCAAIPSPADVEEVLDAAAAVAGGDRDQRRSLPPGSAAEWLRRARQRGLRVRHLDGRPQHLRPRQPALRRRHGSPGGDPPREVLNVMDVGDFAAAVAP